MWATRCVAEAQLHEQNSFITLTYADEHLPWDGSLTPSHFQKFVKKLRRRLSSSQAMKYYMAGEYGENFSRPHFHACLFGVDFPDKTILWENEGIITYTSDFLERLWGKGMVSIGEVNFETAAYTARYICKKVTGDKAHDHYTTTHPITGEVIHLQPEYNRMSLRPAVGKEWFEKYKDDCYPSDFLIHNKRKIKIPRYFDKLFEMDNPHELEQIKKKRKAAAKKNPHNSEERLAVREKVKKLTMNKITRTFENGTQNL